MSYFDRVSKNNILLYLAYVAEEQLKRLNFILIPALADLGGQATRPGPISFIFMRLSGKRLVFPLNGPKIPFY